ncbi:MAG TPA: tetratricopeptide repeat protein [Vicinamibacterales bacterium]|nr:tetratricopeptide repeat protein [Vicinamibacterales bacterium]
MRLLLAGVLALVVAAPQTPPGGVSSPGQIRGTMRPPPQKTRSATGDALDRYAKGDYEGAVSVLWYLGGFSTVDADEWIRRNGPGEAEHRRLIAATLALDIAAAKDAWPVAMIEWACEGFRRAGPPTPVEDVWMRASVALAEGDGIWFVLTADNHLGHALGRFPDDGRLKLAQPFVTVGRATEPEVTTGTTVTDQTTMAADFLAARIVDRTTQGGARQAAQFERAAAEYTALASDPEVGAEARLRLGDLLLRLGRADAAAEQFRQASAAAGDPFVAYLARLSLAWTDASAGRADDAVRGYQSALGVVPHARSASMLLATLFMTQGRMADAETTVEGFLKAPPAGDDPWRQYPRGDLRLYPKLVAQLREAIK